MDAPCSGSGTWRRSPHLRWQTDAAALPPLAEQQLAILCGAARRVRPGGLLLYATCSLAEEENEGVARRFLESDEGRQWGPGLLPGAAALGLQVVGGSWATIPPHLHDTDGFFVAAFERKASEKGGQ